MDQTMKPKDWADMRVFQAVYEKGSLSAAASHLDLTQPSVGRRLTDLEERFGTTLFVRTGRKMEPTDIAQALYRNALAMEQEMMAVERTVEIQSTQLSGLVRITATEGLGSEWLAPYLAEFSAENPEIEIEIIVSNKIVDLVHREADIAIRLGRPTEAELIARKLIDVPFSLYASPKYLESARPINRLSDLNGHDFAVLRMRDFTMGITSEFTGRIEEEVGDYNVRLATNSPTALIAAARAGFGITVLSDRWASLYPDLVKIVPGEIMMSAECWLVTHEELRHSARIRAVADFLAKTIKQRDKSFADAFSPLDQSQL